MLRLWYQPFQGKFAIGKVGKRGASTSPLVDATGDFWRAVIQATNGGKDILIAKMTDGTYELQITKTHDEKGDVCS